MNALPKAPPWLEAVLRILATILGMYFASAGASAAAQTGGAEGINQLIGGLSGLAIGAVGDVPFRAVSSGLSSARKDVAAEVVVEKVVPPARKAVRDGRKRRK
jgi:hypothetical protein